jgi:hypothetical protein
MGISLVIRVIFGRLRSSDLELALEASQFSARLYILWTIFTIAVYSALQSLSDRENAKTFALLTFGWVLGLLWFLAVQL